MTRWALAAGDFTPLGGMDRANHALARYLSASGRDVHLVAHRVWPDLASLPRVTVHQAPRPLGSHLLGAGALARTADRAARQLGPGTLFLSNGGNTRWQSATWIHYLHAAYEPHAAGLRSRLALAASRRRFLEAEARTIARAPRIICNSERTAADVGRHYRVPSARIAVVYYGVNAEQFGRVDDAARVQARAALRLDPSRPLAVFVGALGDRRKGFDVLFEAWRDLTRDPSWDANLAVVGAGAEGSAWQRRAVRHGIADRMTFLGFRTDVASVMAAADVVVHPARYEAYGLGVHEAICRGLPAIVSAAAGVAERLPPGLQPLTLPEPLAAADLVERFRRWRADVCGWRERAQVFGCKLRGRSWDDMARQIAAVVEGS